MTNRQQIPIWVLPMNLVLSVAVAILGAWVWLLSSHGLPREQLEALQLVHQQIENEHVQPPAGEDLMWSAIEGMVRSVDEHSEFVPPAKVAAFEEDTTGTYVGIGIVMESIDDELRVRFPLAGGPSEDILEVGDTIVAVSGVEVAGDTEGDLRAHAQELLMGPTGTKVTVAISRNGNEPTTHVITRGNVHKPSVKWARIIEPEQRIGYVYIQSFQQQTAKELRAALDHIDEEATGGPMRALIVDLRFDRGGLLDEAIAIANEFIPDGTIVSLERRDSNERTVHEADSEKCSRPELPLVLLVNDRSASASEVFAGAVQDHERGRLVGARTFGKGYVQSIFRWRDLDFRLKLTTAYYYTPNGRRIHRAKKNSKGAIEGGIEPDRLVELTRADRTMVWNGVHESFEPPLRYREAVRVFSLAMGRTVGPPGADRDPQLAAVLEEARDLAAETSPK